MSQELKTIKDLHLFCNLMNGPFTLFGHNFVQDSFGQFDDLRVYYACTKCSLEIEQMYYMGHKSIIIFENNTGLEYDEKDKLQDVLISCEKRMNLQTIKNIIE